MVPLGNRDIGFLPGDVKSKLDPYMQPLWDNISRDPAPAVRPRAASHKALAEMIEHEKIMVAPLAYIRGRSLDQRLLHRGRGAEPDAARGEDDHHARRRGLQGRPHRRHPTRSTRPTSISQSNGLTFLVDRMKDRGALRAREPGEGRAQPARRARMVICCSPAPPSTASFGSPQSGVDEVAPKCRSTRFRRLGIVTIHVEFDLGIRVRARREYTHENPVDPRPVPAVSR